MQSSSGVVEEANARTLMALPRLAVADLGVFYSVIACACAEYACRRATEPELEVVHRVLAEARELPPGPWRRRITDVQLELAALSQSVRLTSEHVRVQAEFTPLLSLQDVDPVQRHVTHDALILQIEAIRARDQEVARRVVHQSISSSVQWLTAFRQELVALPDDAAFKTMLSARREGAARHN